MQQKNLTLCADDFGMNAGISQGILELVRAGRLSAVSCMVNQPDFVTFAPDLLSLKGQVQIGLHINLTEGSWLSKPKFSGFSLKSILIRSHIKYIDPLLITQEITAQLDRFSQIMGFAPDFIDGHQHVHQLPVIRDVLCKLYLTRLSNQSTYIRSTFPTFSLPKYRFKTGVIVWTGGRQLYYLLNKYGIPHNSAFAGIYDFSKEADYRALFRQWLGMVPDNSLIMCHPGRVEEELGTSIPSSALRAPSPHVLREGTNEERQLGGDAIGHARSQELSYFLSNDFINDCMEFNFVYEKHIKSRLG